MRNLIGLQQIVVQPVNVFDLQSAPEYYLIGMTSLSVEDWMSLKYRKLDRIEGLVAILQSDVKF